MIGDIIKNTNCKNIRKFILVIVATLLLSSLILLIFKEFTVFIYDFKLQNYLMILLLIILFIKYYKNFYQLVVWINCILVCICLSINLVGCFYAGKYQFIGIKAMHENYYILTAIVSLVFWIISQFIFNRKSKNYKNDINEYIKKIIEDEELFDCHKDDAEYICKFLFESNLKTLGISARYGMGKTVIINKVIEITSSKKNLYVEISPLSCNIEEIPTYIISQIEKVLKENGIYTNNTRQIINTIQNEYLSSILNIINDNQTLSELYKNLHNLIERLDIQLIIIVDDLDRIYSKKQIQMIFIILDVIVSHNCKIIYLYDSFNLNRFFDDECGEKYIEKYIQNEYPLKNLTFRDLVKIENDSYLNNNDTTVNRMIYKIIDNEIGAIEFSTEIYGLQEEYLVFNIYKLTPREINKIIKMTYEKLSDKEYIKAIKEYEKYVFRYFVTIFYYPEIKKYITNFKKIDSSLIFEYNKEKMTLRQVLGKFFSATKYGRFQTEEQYNEYIEFIKVSNNVDKLITLNLLGYNIEILRKNIQNESEEETGFKVLNHKEQVYNKFYRKVDRDFCYYRDYYNEKKMIAIISNLINESYSEYTDDEWFAKHFKENVLDNADILVAYNKYSFESYKDNQEIANLLALNKFTAIFISINKAKVESNYWNKLMELYYKYLLNNNKIIFNDIILTNICIFGFDSYKASIYAFMIISKLSFENSENKFFDVVFIPKIMSMIKDFINKKFGIDIRFYYPDIEKYIRFDDVKEHKKHLIDLKDEILNFIKNIDDIDDTIKEKFENDLSYIKSALNKILELINNASQYKDSINRSYFKASTKIVPPDISVYKGKSREEIDSMFDEDLGNSDLRPTDYKRIMDEFNNE